MTPTGSFAGDQIDRTFHPGVHSTSGAFANTGTITLDADGNPNALFVFQINAAMGPAAGSHVVLVGGAKASNVFWQVNGAVTVGANAEVSGTLLAQGAITLGDGVVLIGRALATGTVTMTANSIRFTAAPPPAITIDGRGPSGATDVTKDVTPTLSGTSNAAPGSPVTLRTAGQVASTTVLADGTWHATLAALAAGTRTVLASVRDAAGNNGSASQVLTVEVNPDPVTLGSAGSYSLLGRSGVTATGVTTVSGDLGLSPAGAMTGFPPDRVGGEAHDKDAPAAQARADLETTYEELDARTPHQVVAGDLAGQTFHAGIYHQTAAMQLTGTVTLDAEGDPSAVFIFQGEAAFNTAASARVSLIGGAQPGNVYWQVQGAVNTGAGTTLAGTVVTKGAVTLGAGTTLLGRALSYGAVTAAGTAVRFTTALAPSSSIDGDAPNGATATTSDSTPTLTGTTSAAAGRPVVVTIGGQSLSTIVGPDASWSVTAADLSPGTYQVVVSVHDAAGNGSHAYQALTITTP